MSSDQDTHQGRREELIPGSYPSPQMLLNTLMAVPELKPVHTRYAYRYDSGQAHRCTDIHRRLPAQGQGMVVHDAHQLSQFPTPWIPSAVTLKNQSIHSPLMPAVWLPSIS